jgi:hypothetical protein
VSEAAESEETLPLEFSDMTGALFESFYDEEFRPDLYQARKISFQDAKRIIIWGHYTGSLTKGRHCFGLFRKGALVGAAVYGQPSGRGVAASMWEGGDERNTLELLRLFVMDGTGKNAETWFMARCHRMLPAEVKLLVAYSAPGVGHHGGCYQAGNWLFLGQSKSGQNYYYRDAAGDYVNKRIPWQYGPRNGLPYNEAESAELLGLTRVNEPRKMVYVLPRARGVVKLLKRPVMVYPKPDILPARESASVEVDYEATA